MENASAVGIFARTNSPSFVNFVLLLFFTPGIHFCVLSPFMKCVLFFVVDLESAFFYRIYRTTTTLLVHKPTRPR